MKLHHIGIAVKNIQESIKIYKDLFGFSQVSKIVADKTQKVNVVFFSINETHIQIELIAPLADESPIKNFLKKGGGLYHLCFETENIKKDIEKYKKNGAKLISKPVEAEAFKKKIAFLFFRGYIIELLES